MTRNFIVLEKEQLRRQSLTLKDILLRLIFATSLLKELISS